MSLNLIDTTLFERLDCIVESHYHRTFARRQIYEVEFREPENQFENNSFEINFVVAENEQNDLRYSSIQAETMSNVAIKNQYNSPFKLLLMNALESCLGNSYLIEEIENKIYLMAIIKGRAGTPSIPKIRILNETFCLKLILNQAGEDTDIFIPQKKRNMIHIPTTGRGSNYKSPQIGDRVIIVDSLEDKDRSFTREVIEIKFNANCTCDILTLDLPIDRLEKNHSRVDGIGLQRQKNSDIRYTASFSKTQIFLRKKNAMEILSKRSVPTFTNAIPIRDNWGMRLHASQIAKDQLAYNRKDYFGCVFHWSVYKVKLASIYQEFGQYLCDHLFVLTSNKDRPDYLLHIDYHHEFPQQSVVASLTWPALSCDNDTVTVWYESSNNQILGESAQDKVIYDPTISLTESDRYYFNSEVFNPILLRHDKLHTLYNSSGKSEERVLLQWRFRPELSWDEIEVICKKIKN